MRFLLLAAAVLMAGTAAAGPLTACHITAMHRRLQEQVGKHDSERGGQSAGEYCVRMAMLLCGD